MTYEEQQQYNNLSYSKQRKYDEIKNENPSWSHNQIMFKLGMLGKIDDICNQGRDPDPDDPRIMKEILEGAKSFLIGVGIVVGTVIVLIDEALETLGDLIYKGISYIGDRLQEFWDWLWD